MPLNFLGFVRGPKGRRYVQINPCLIPKAAQADEISRQTGLDAAHMVVRSRHAPQADPEWRLSNLGGIIRAKEVLRAPRLFRIFPALNPDHLLRRRGVMKNMPT